MTNHHGKSVFENRFSKFSIPNCFGIRSVELSVPSGLNAADATNSDRDQREDDRADRHEMAPADGEEPVLAGHRLISSRAAVRRNPMIENTATITKIRTEMAAANPYWAPPSVNASR